METCDDGLLVLVHGVGWMDGYCIYSTGIWRMNMGTRDTVLATP